MRILYERGLGTLPKGEFAGGKVRQARERFQWPLALVAACLIFEFLLPEQKRQRGLAKQPESGKQAKVGGSEVAS
jgi:hypothetical protein